MNNWFWALTTISSYRYDSYIALRKISHLHVCTHSKVLSVLSSSVVWVAKMFTRFRVPQKGAIDVVCVA